MATVIEELGGWDADRLARLLTFRPGLAGARDLPALAQAIPHGQLVAEAVEDLNAGQRQVLEAVSLLRDGSPMADLHRLAPSQDVAARLSELVADLEDRFLLWPGAQGLHLVGPVRSYLPSPLRLGRSIESCHEYTTYGQLCELVQRWGEPRPRSSAAARAALLAVFSDMASLAQRLAELPPGARQILERVDREGPVLRWPGVDPFRLLVPPDPELVALLEWGLLAAVGVSRIELPREVALALRRPAVVMWQLDPPAARAGGAADGPGRVAQLGASAGAAVEGLLQVAITLVDRLEVRPVPLLASGSVGVKEVRLLAQDVCEPTLCVLVLTLLERLGLLHASRKDLRSTRAWPGWLTLPPSRRWTDLVRAWLGCYDLPAHRPDGPRRLGAALGVGFDARGPRDRLRCLVLVADPQALPGVDLAAAWDWRWPPERLTAHAASGRVPDAELRRDVLYEATCLGLVVDGAPSPLVAALRDEARSADVPTSAADSRPCGVEAVLEGLAVVGEQTVRAQADMTLVCTGVPSRLMRLSLGRVADVEQTGAATVWRVSESSLSRAYDEGDTVEDVLAVLRRHAGRLPQAMEYLVGDAQRRHGQVRVGHAASFVVVADDAVLRDALAAKGAAGTAIQRLGLRRVAPGVAISMAAVEETVAALRSLGVPAVGESGPGRVAGTRVGAAVGAPAGSAIGSRSGAGPAAVRRATTPAVRPLPPLPDLDPAATATVRAQALLG